MTIDWSRIPRDAADDNLNLLRNGMRTTLPEMYVLPRQATAAHENLVRRMREGRWGFVLVQGENGAGKSVYVRHVEHVANSEGYTIVHVELNEKTMRQYGAAGYFNREIVDSLRLPDGETFLYKLRSNEDFRRRVAAYIERDAATYEFFSTSLTQALLAACGQDSDKRNIALSWLRGEPKGVGELRNLGIYDRGMKSLLNLPTDKVLYFVKELCHALEHKGVLVSVDEIERVGTLPPAKGKEALSVLRDLINILVSEDSMPTKRGLAGGTFVCYAISTFFLGYSGIVEVGGVDFKAQADKYGKPNVTLGDIPRLSSVLQNSASTVTVDFESLDDLERVAVIVKGCYDRARECEADIIPQKLARNAYDATGVYLARQNIQMMIRHLDELCSTR